MLSKCNISKKVKKSIKNNKTRLHEIIPNNDDINMEEDYSDDDYSDRRRPGSYFEK